MSMNTVFSIDRFVASLAVLERQDGALLHVLRCFLPPDAREGDCVAFNAGRWTICPEQTEAVRDEVFDLMESLFDE